MRRRSESLPCTYRPALPTWLDESLMPKLPAWYPLPARDENGELLPEQPDEAERARQRHARAVLEACQGPIDNTRGQVALDVNGEPPAEQTLVEGRCVYVRCDDESNRRHVIYRYSPQLSLIHSEVIRGVEAGFNEHGQDYALEASHDDEHAATYGQQRPR
jgi:hypothetical protein